VTEVPEHLLQRSRDRRAALGLGGGDAGDSSAATPAAESTAAAVEPSAAAAPAAPAAAARATPAVPEPAAPKKVPAYVAASMKRSRVPVWAVPVLAGMIFWAPIYIGTLETPEPTGGPLVAGEEIYATACAGCHGASGGGGSGRQLSGGEVLLTFPDWRDQVEFVAHGSAEEYLGVPYGDPDRPGGQHVGGSFSANGMPPQGIAYGGGLTRLELLEVVLHERTLSGEDPEESELLAYIEAVESQGLELPEEGDLPEIELEEE
jgi:hypothetical protein